MVTPIGMDTYLSSLFCTIPPTFTFYIHPLSPQPSLLVVLLSDVRWECYGNETVGDFLMILWENRITAILRKLLTCVPERSDVCAGMCHSEWAQRKEKREKLDQTERESCKQCKQCTLQAMHKQRPRMGTMMKYNAFFNIRSLLFLSRLLNTLIFPHIYPNTYFESTTF